MPPDAPEPAAEQASVLSGLVAVIMAGESYRNAAAEFFGLGLADTHALSYLDTHGSMTQSTLARLMGVTSAGATGVVDRLERADIARRVPDPHDRRRYRIELTDRAHTIVEESTARLHRILADLEPDALALLEQALPQLAAGLDREARLMRSDGERARQRLKPST